MHYLEDLHNLHITTPQAPQPPEDVPQNMLRIGKSVNGRQVFVADKPTELFDNILTQFEGAIVALDARCKFVFQHVHQRRCEVKLIKDEYAKWSSEIADLDKAMVSLWDSACVYAKAMRTEAVASQFFSLHMYATDVTLTKKNLISALAEVNQAWLMAYKSNSEVNKKSIAKDFLAKGTVETPLQPTLQYLKEATTHKLPDENCFRTGTKGASTYWWNIKGQTDVLYNVAQALHKLEGEYRSLLQKVCMGKAIPEEAATMHQVSFGLINVVYEQIKALITIDDKHEPHAGLDYANALVEQGRALSGNCLELVNLSKNHMGNIRQALEIIKAAKSVDGLYDAIIYIRDLSCQQTDCKMLYEVLEHTLIKIGQEICKLTKDEETVLDCLATRKIPLQGLEKDLKFYLMKRFIANLYFSDELVDPKLDCVLYILQTDAVYRGQLADFLGAEGPLRLLYNSYVAYAKLNGQKDLHAAMTAILGQLQTSDNPSIEEKYVRFRRAEEALNALEQKIDSRHAKWLFINQRFITRKDEWDKEISKFRKCDNEGQIALYGHLSSRLFSHSDVIRSEAEKAIIRIVNQPDMIKARIPEVLRFLLKRWAIERLVEERRYCREHTITWSAPKLTKYEQEILEQLLTEYLTDPLKRAFWHSLYDVGYMELLLQDYRSKYETFVTHGVRCDKDFSETNAVLDVYRKFRVLVQRDQLLFPDSNKPTSEAQELYIQAKECLNKETDIEAIAITDPKEYGEVSLYLLRQMHNFIYAKQSIF
ncbi:MAG: hypothetical protein LLF94_08765 [Chlamydiales bacterium]|nr:hypothetical protein [Chlamydiales bacterium]